MTSTTCNAANATGSVDDGANAAGATGCASDITTGITMLADCMRVSAPNVADAG